MLGVIVWLPWMTAPGGRALTGLSLSEWHKDMLQFGTVPAMLAGFLLTALPRWTGGRRVSAAGLWGLTGLWLLGRTVFLFVSSTAGLGVFTIFILMLLSIASARILPANDRRNWKTLLLLLALLASVVLATVSPADPFADRVALASLVGLLIVIGGRVTPALTIAHIESRAGQIALRRPTRIEHAAAAAAACALIAWLAIPDRWPTALLAGLAAFAQALRLVQWQFWRCATVPSLLALHLGYGWIVVGFALLALHIWVPDRLAQAAAVHAWTVGGIGTMALALMASMIRRHSGRAFAASRLATAAFVSITLCSASRLLVELLPDQATFLAATAGSVWIAAFALFLAAHWRLLLRPT